MIDQKLNQIKTSYMNYFKVKDKDLQIITTDDMYSCQKNYGFTESDLRILDEAKAKASWNHVAACMRYPKSMDEPFTLIFKRPYLQRVDEAELYRLMFHELTHYVDYKEYARIHKLNSYRELFRSQETVLFQNWSEYHAERRGYGAYLKHRHGVRLKYEPSPRKIKIMEDETLKNMLYYAEHYINTAEYGESRQIYFTMHLLSRISIWLQILPYQVEDILTNQIFKYRGMEWIKNLLYLFLKYPTLEQMDPHFPEMVRIIAESMTLSKEEVFEHAACLDALDEIIF
ncbi:MAG: hypothetical protein IKX76_03540 [Eubacterium sp.]|nr:hypothetical protein [Eubacterium sp.]